MDCRTERSIAIMPKSLYVTIGMIFFLMPYIAVLKHGFPLIRIGDTSLTALIKDALTLYFVTFGALIIASAKNCFKVDSFEVVTGLLLAFASTKTIISTATLTQALTSFRHEFLFVIFAIVLYRLCRMGVLNSKTIQMLFSKTLALNMAIVVSIGYAEIANKEILSILYGEQAMNLVTGIPGIPEIRSVSTLENPINLALFLTLCTTYFTAMTPSVAIKHLLIAAVTLPLIVATFSRIFVVLYLLIFTVLLTRYFVQSTISGKLRFTAFAFIAVATATNIASTATQSIDITEVVETRVLQTIDSIQSKDDPRFENWEAAFRNLNSYPIIGPIGGIGLGLSNPGDFEEGQFRIENSFLSIYLQLGLFGLILYLSPTAMAIGLALKQKMPNQGARTLAIALIILAGGLTNDSHRNMPFSFYLWICLTLTFLAYKTQSNSNHKLA